MSSSINRRCLEEAMSVQDMLSPAPPRKTGFARAHDRWVAAVGSLHSRVSRIRGEVHGQLQAGSSSNRRQRE